MEFKISTLLYGLMLFGIVFTVFYGFAGSLSTDFGVDINEEGNNYTTDYDMLSDLEDDINETRRNVERIKEGNVIQKFEAYVAGSWNALIITIKMAFNAMTGGIKVVTNLSGDVKFLPTWVTTFLMAIIVLGIAFAIITVIFKRKT